MTTNLIFFGLVVLLFGVRSEQPDMNPNGSFPRGRTIRNYIRAQIRQQRISF